MPYSRELKPDEDLAYLRMRGQTEAIKKIEKALAEGKKVEWICSLFQDPGDDYNKVMIDGEQVYHEDGF